MPVLISTDFNGSTAANWPSTWVSLPYITHVYQSVTQYTFSTLSTSGVSALRTGSTTAANATTLEGGHLDTLFNVNATGGLTTHAETGHRVARVSFDIGAPANFNGNPPLGINKNTVWGVGFVSSATASNAQKALLLCVTADTSSGALTFFARKWDGVFPNIIGLTTYASQSLGTATAGATVGTLGIRMTLEPNILRIQAQPSWTPWPAEVTLTASQVFDAMNVAQGVTLLSLPMFAFLQLAGSAFNLNGASQRATLDNFSLENVLAVPIGITVPALPSPTYTQAQAQPTATAETTLAALASITSENDGSVEVLSVQPSYSVQIDDKFDTIEHPYDAGYFVSHAGATRRRRTWRMNWAAITTAEFTSLFALSVAIQGAKKSFLWTDAETGEQVRCYFAGPLSYSLLAPTVYAAEGVAVEALA